MADSVQSTQTQPELEGAAAGGLISLLESNYTAAVAAGNQQRAAAYQDLQAAAQEFRLRLSNLDPQADSAVLTQVTAVLATI
jgi:hypothetical protein